MQGGDSEQDLVTTSIRVTEEQKEWIDSNQSFNFSGFVRDALDERIGQDAILDWGDVHFDAPAAIRERFDTPFDFACWLENRVDDEQLEEDREDDSHTRAEMTIRRDCPDCGEEIDHEEWDYCPHCGTETLDIEYGVLRQYNTVGDTEWESYDDREEALSTAREYIQPENCPDHYDWTVDEDPDADDEIWRVEEGRLGVNPNAPAEVVSVIAEVDTASHTSAGDAE